MKPVAVLVFCADAAVRKLLAGALDDDERCRVVFEAETVEGALRIYRDHPFGLVVADRRSLLATNDVTYLVKNLKNIRPKAVVTFFGIASDSVGLSGLLAAGWTAGALWSNAVPRLHLKLREISNF